MTSIHLNDLVLTLYHGANRDAALSGTPHVVEGLSDSATQVSFENIDIYSSIVRAPDGTTEAFTTGNTGGPVSFEFMASSPSVKWFLDRIAEIKTGARVEVYGVSVNNATGLTVSLHRGYINSGPIAPSYGTDGLSRMTFTITFQDIAANTAGMMAQSAGRG